MAEDWTSDGLLVSIREQGSLSPDEPDFADAILLRAANRELQRRFVPLVRKARADYYVTHYDQALVSGQGAYEIPSRATTTSVRTVVLLDSQGRVERKLSPVPFEDQFDYAESGSPQVYMIQDDRVVLLPAPNTGVGSVRIYFELRPSTLVLQEDAQLIGIITQETETGCRVSTSGGNFAASWDNAPADIVKPTPPFRVLVRDNQLTAFDLNTLIVTYASWDSPLTDEDSWICNAGETVFPPLPAELHPLLALATAVQVLLPVDPASAADLQRQLNEGLVEVGDILSPRKQGEQVKLRPRSGPMRRGMNGRRGTFDDFGNG